MIGGLKGSGKTTFICALLHLGRQYGLSPGAFKPFDAGLLRRNADEEFGDGELFCRYMDHQPAETLVAPYYAHESYPLEMSLRRDGIRVDWKMLDERIALLNEHYHPTLIELPDSLFAPITVEKRISDWMLEHGGPVVWLVHPLAATFTQNLAEITQLKHLGIPFELVMNNVSRIRDQDLMFYVWEKIEGFADQPIIGLIPHVRKLPTTFDALGRKIEANLPDLVARLLQPRR
jgi:dethiobiotin synthetase